MKAWEDHRVSLGYAETCRTLTGWKRVRGTAWLKETSSTVLQQSLRHLDSAFSRFFKGSAKYPRRKSKHRSKDSATYVRTGFRWVEDPNRPGTASVTLAKQTAPRREPKAVGLDLGLATLVTMDDGEKLPHPRLLSLPSSVTCTGNRRGRRTGGRYGSGSPACTPRSATSVVISWTS
ncbi:hypothetical protein [Streptomyces lavendulae]|uniref:hypothetical protein n=1 Tax=Streptomyces lavendulae TaxID=1914 RepID=UPI0036E3683B